MLPLEMVVEALSKMVGDDQCSYLPPDKLVAPMCDDCTPGSISRHFKDGFIGKLKNAFLLRKPSYKRHLYHAERLEARIVLAGTPFGAAQTLVADAEVADTLDVSGLWQPMV